MLSSQENDILEYLKPFQKEFISAKEVCRRAGGKMRFSKDPDWAKPLLKRMEKAGLLEMDALGHYRIKPPKEEEGGSGKKKRAFPVSPQMQKILSQSGKDFGKVYILHDEESPTPSSRTAPGKRKKNE